MAKIDGVLSRTDWRLLAKQKVALIKACEKDPELDGIVIWIDAIQDAAEEDGHSVMWY